jgi:hypothetical protein
VLARRNVRHSCGDIATPDGFYTAPIIFEVENDEYDSLSIHKGCRNMVDNRH